jgi:plasmid replication initiation protein
MTRKKQDITVKKHVNAIHINGELSLLQRKLANALLYHAYPLLPVQDRYEIDLGILRDLVGFESHDNDRLKEALRGLQKTLIQWSVLDEKGRETWGSMPLLGSVFILEKEGICRYSYDTFLREKLYNPEIYATINLDIQKKFGSKYALALYENCARYREVGSTGWMAIEVFRQLLGCENQATYDEFKRLSTQVIKPAVQEVNETSDIEVTPEYKRQSRKVESVRMKVKDKRDLPPLRAGRPKAVPAADAARVRTMVDAAADREREAQAKVDAERAFRDMKAILGRASAGSPDSDQPAP